MFRLGKLLGFFSPFLLDNLKIRAVKPKSGSYLLLEQLAPRQGSLSKHVSQRRGLLFAPTAGSHGRGENISEVSWLTSRVSR